MRRRKSVEVGYRDYKGLLQLAVVILPPGQRIVLLADRGFGHAGLVRFARAHQWGFRLWARFNTVVHFNRHQIATMARLCPPREHAHFSHNVAILGEPINGVHLTLANPEAPDEEPWFIISSDPTPVDTLDEYALRFDIEENFLDTTTVPTEPGSDPEPAIASRKHAGRPQRRRIVTYAGSP